ncbi:patatin-like phospholipase family protein [Solemya velum gill symbiont]|nr:patatin-like phospholipase family protein [Solemya velum gill symbiont]
MPGLQTHTLILVSVLILSACTGFPREHAAPSKENYTRAQVTGFHDIRYWGDEAPPYIDKVFLRLKSALKTNPSMRERVDVLALSGGAEDGAYGAGLLKGWTQRGGRPEFTVVTGVSTGALIAPFAFLGPEYDASIKRFFTETSKKDIFLFTPFTAIFGGTSLGDTKPLRRIIREEVDEEFVQAIARESLRGRILLISTTNLDAQRPVIWDIGRIAESGHPDATIFIRNIMLASSAVPGIFPPVITNVTIDGKQYQEVHVDGGVTNQIFVYPHALRVREMERHLRTYPKKKTFWLIRNTKIDPEYKPVDLTISDIASRSISTLIKYQGRGNLLNISNLAKRDGFDINLTHVPQDFDVAPNELFDPDYMNALYQAGYDVATSDKAWQNSLEELLEE